MELIHIDGLFSTVTWVYLGVGIAVWRGVQIWEWYEERGPYEIQAVSADQPTQPRLRRGSLRSVQGTPES